MAKDGICLSTPAQVNKRLIISSWDHLEEDTHAQQQVATALVTTQMRLAGESDDFGEDDEVEVAFGEIG